MIARWVAALRARVRVAAAAEPYLGWLLPAALVGYVLYVTLNWNFPAWWGVPFAPIFLALSALGIGGWWRLRGRPGPIVSAVIVVLAIMLMTDAASFWTQPFRDIEIYIKAGGRWLAGAPVYSLTPIARAPADLSDYPFLYPPITLPLFGALALLPLPIAIALWTAASAFALVIALRFVGLRGRWIVLILLWPPVVQGLLVGNVAVPLFALFAVAPWRPAGLVIPPLFKVYSGIAALWLLRREHWPALARGCLAAAAFLVLTLPVVNPALWLEWVRGLQVYEQSQRLLTNLYGFGLGRQVPTVVVLAIGVVAVAIALSARRRLDQLARLGVATIVASPSLFSHGFLVALPAMVRLERRWFWLAFGLTACAPGIAWFVALGIVAASWYLPELRRGAGRDDWHPLGAAAEPWPAAPDRRRERPGVTSAGLEPVDAAAA
jgi:hypothetical protein